MQSVFDELDGEEMRRARTRSNPYEMIRGVFFLNRSVALVVMWVVFSLRPLSVVGAEVETHRSLFMCSQSCNEDGKYGPCL